MYAIIETGGKQYRVQKDDVFQVEKINAKVGDEITFDKVVAICDDNLKVGKPYLNGYKVTAEVMEQGKGKKIIVFKYKAKKDYRKKNGHRQPYTAVKILSIGLDNVSSEDKKAEIKTNKSEATSVDNDVKVSMSMKKDELLAIAENANINISKKATKQEIIDAINGTN